MDQQNNIAALNDTAGVLPMDTGATVNGIHDEVEHHSSSVNAGAKKGRGRPPKSAGSIKASVINNSDAPKRARGRPAKSGETSSPVKNVVAVPPKKKEEVAPATNGNGNQKKRGRPSKTSTPNEQNNVISKPQVQSIPVINHEEENGDEPAKKKRGRPSGGVPKKPVVVASPSPLKEAASTKKRGRPSGSAGVKKLIVKPKVSATANGSAKKRGRPKKAGASPAETPVVAAPVNETTTVTPNNVQ